MPFIPDGRPRTTHQILHLTVQRDEMVRNGRGLADIREIDRMLSGVNQWPDSRMYPANIHDYFSEDQETRDDLLLGVESGKEDSSRT
jgi:hypothetical protein